VDTRAARGASAVLSPSAAAGAGGFSHEDHAAMVEYADDIARVVAEADTGSEAFWAYAVESINLLGGRFTGAQIRDEFRRLPVGAPSGESDQAGDGPDDDDDDADAYADHRETTPSPKHAKPAKRAKPARVETHKPAADTGAVVLSAQTDDGLGIEAADAPFAPPPSVRKRAAIQAASTPGAFSVRFSVADATLVSTCTALHAGTHAPWTAAGKCPHCAAVVFNFGASA